MQTRVIRLASEKWHLPMEEIVELFKNSDVLGYIENGYGIFFTVRVMMLYLSMKRN